MFFDRRPGVIIVFSISMPYRRVLSGLVWPAGDLRIWNLYRALGGARQETDAGIEGGSKEAGRSFRNSVLIKVIVRKRFVSRNSGAEGGLGGPGCVWERGRQVIAGAGR